MSSTTSTDGGARPIAREEVEETRELLATVARRYYVDDESKVSIANELGISRFRVARMLRSARDAGVVRISIDQSPAEHAAIAAELVDRLGLARCAVLGGAHNGGSLEARRARLGELAARELSQILLPADVLGLPWSRAVSATVSALQAIPPVSVVQLSGARFEPGSNSSAAPADMVRDLAALGGGRAYRFHAPFVAPDEAAAESLRGDPAFAAAHDQVAAITVAVVGVGAFDPRLSTLYAAASPAEIEELRRGSAVGEVGGVFVDADGVEVGSRFGRRLLTMRAAELRAIPEVIGVCLGAERANAVLAACRGELLNSLVIDVPLARGLLAHQ